jgi:hypothetical protein
MEAMQENLMTIADLSRYDNITYYITVAGLKITKRNRQVYENKGPAFLRPLGH